MIFLLALVVLLIASVEDLWHQEVNNYFCLILLSLGIVFQLFVGLWLGAIIGLIVFMLLGIMLWPRVWGAGDGKIIGGLGMLLGFDMKLALCFWFFIGVSMIVKSSMFKGKKVAFVPFISLSLLCTMLYFWIW